MTNADVIRKMTDKQLFEFLSEWEVGDIDYSITFCDLCMESKREGGKGNELGLDCDGCREHWLKRDAVDYSGLLYWKKNTTYGERGRGMKKLWKKVTPIPPEMNGHGYLWDCTKCGYCLTSTDEYPKCKCPKCGASEVENE